MSATIGGATQCLICSNGVREADRLRVEGEHTCIVVHPECYATGGSL